MQFVISDVGWACIFLCVLVWCAPRCAGCRHEMKLQMPAGEVGRCALGHRYGWRCVVFEAKGSK